MTEENERVVKCRWGLIYLTPIEIRTAYGVQKMVYIITERDNFSFVQGIYNESMLQKSDKELCDKFS